MWAVLQNSCANLENDGLILLHSDIIVFLPIAAMQGFLFKKSKNEVDEAVVWKRRW